MIRHVLNKLVRESDIRTRPHLCSRVRYPRSQCRLCQEICPVNAVEITHDSVQLGTACRGCEVCVPACPNGVFTLPGRKEKERRDQLKKGLGADPAARFTCVMDTQRDEDSSVVLPCLAALSEAYLIAPFAWGGDKVQIKRVGCSKCPFSSVMVQYESLLARTRSLLAAFGIPAHRIAEVKEFDVPGVPSSGTVCPSPEGMDRREFFGFFRKRTVEAAARLIPEAETGLREPRWSHRENPMRTFLLELLSSLGGAGHKVLPGEDLSTVDVVVSETCIGCKVCETLCPTGAIRREGVEGEGLRLLFRPSRCTGCRICGEACHPRAISFTESIDLNELMRGEERELILVRPKTCSACGKPFQGVLGDICPACFDVRRGNRV